MAFDKATMISEMKQFMSKDDPSFTGFPTDENDFASKMSAAYDAAGGASEDTSTDAVLTKNPTGMETALQSVVSGNTAAQGASAFGTGFSSYWTGATFAIGTVPTGATPCTGGSPACPNVGGNTIFASEITSVVTAVVPAPIIAALTTEFGIIEENDADAKIDAIADHLEAATQADVTVLISGLDTTPPPSGGPMPITNTCCVF
ncbi:MAG: hypothetical protein MJA83_05660 [Gammaproteobacteria bacterium]|nr:hypothetical protein [Gammaproteobacteria bacterium]